METRPKDSMATALAMARAVGVSRAQPVRGIPSRLQTILNQHKPHTLRSWETANQNGARNIRGISLRVGTKSMGITIALIMSKVRDGSQIFALADSVQEKVGNSLTGYPVGQRTPQDLSVLNLSVLKDR